MNSMTEEEIKAWFNAASPAATEAQKTAVIRVAEALRGLDAHIAKQIEGEIDLAAFAADPCFYDAARALLASGHYHEPHMRAALTHLRVAQAALFGLIHSSAEARKAEASNGTTDAAQAEHHITMKLNLDAYQTAMYYVRTLMTLAISDAPLPQTP